MLGSPAPAPERAKPGTVDALIEKYKASRFYTEKRPKTKRGYDQNLTIISKWAGDLPVRSITPERVQKLYDAHRERTPAKANAIIRVVRLLRSEEHTSELQSLMRISYAVFCLKTKTHKNTTNH